MLALGQSRVLCELVSEVVLAEGKQVCSLLYCNYLALPCKEAAPGHFLDKQNCSEIYKLIAERFMFVQ